MICIPISICICCILWTCRCCQASRLFFLAGLTVPLGFLRGLVSLEGIEGDESSGSVIASALAGRFNLG